MLLYFILFYCLHQRRMVLLMGQFLVMSGSFFVIFLILWMCISADKSDSTERYSHRNYLRREEQRRKQINRYRNYN